MYMNMPVSILIYLFIFIYFLNFLYSLGLSPQMFNGHIELQSYKVTGDYTI